MPANDVAVQPDSRKMDSNWRSSPVICAIWVLLRPPASGKTVRLLPR